MVSPGVAFLLLVEPITYGSEDRTTGHYQGTANRLCPQLCISRRRVAIVRARVSHWRTVLLVHLLVRLLYLATYVHLRSAPVVLPTALRCSNF